VSVLPPERRSPSRSLTAGRCPCPAVVDARWQRQREPLERRKALAAERDDRPLSARRVLPRLLAMAGLAARGSRNARDLRVCEVDHSPGRSEWRTLRLLQLSDPHFPERRDPVSEAILREAVAATAHDVLVLTGDYRDLSAGPFDGAMAALGHVIEPSRAPAYAVLGNHDPAAMIEPLAAIGVHTLVNRHAVIDSDEGEPLLAIAGIDDPSSYRLHDIDSALEGISPTLSTVLLAHSPCVADEVPADRVQLCLCGHTHGGQIALPGNLAGPLVARTRGVASDTVAGSWNRAGMCGYTSRGTGTSGLDARFRCPPELVVHRLAVRTRSSR